LLKNKKTRELSARPHITVEVSSLCNINCLMCGTKSTTRPRGFIEVDFFEKVIRDIVVPGGQSVITMNTIGETLLHPKLDELFGILEKYAVSLLLVTNGLLSKNVPKRLISTD